MKRLLIILSIILLCGCSAHPSKMSKRGSKKTVQKISYSYDERTGLCFAVVSSRNYWAGMIPMQQQGLGLTVVPCEACKKYLVN